MNNKIYNERTYKKIADTVKYYSDYIFEKISDAPDVRSFMTKEHLRLPPPDEAYAPISKGDKWGGEWENMWLTTTVVVPESAKGKTICLHPSFEAAEILCFKNGVPSGIINSKSNFIGGMHCVMYLSYDAVPGTVYRADMECYAGHYCPGTDIYDNYGQNEAPEGAFDHVYKALDVCVVNETVKRAVFDLQAVLGILRLPEENFIRIRAHDALMNAFPHIFLDPISHTRDEIVASSAKISKALAPVFEKGTPDRTRGMVGIVGHSHLDTAWLWPISETMRKAARTYSEVLSFMEVHPYYKFIQSSALHLDWMREYYPDIFEGIKKRVAEGRYEPNGGVWVECDCNITGGESMIRQFLYGQRFTREHFGYTSDSFWLPDTFGYNAAIPQIMLGCGVSRFYTTKMSWNDLNQFPYDSFIWRGIDGSEVLTHLNMINGIPCAEELAVAISGIKDKTSSDMRLFAYGYGDGGGGPSYGMFEYIDRLTDLPGLPEIRNMGASEFMDELEKRVDKLPLHDGELYLEFHRGTLTMMHDIKKNNRLAEFALRDMEYMNVLCGEPKNEKADDFWKLLLKNQFHDILPGTCIECVNVLARKEVSGLIYDVKSETASYASRLIESGADSSDRLTLFNTLSHDRNDPIVLDGSVAVDRPYQNYTDTEGNEKTVVRASLPAFGAETLSIINEEKAPEPTPFSFDGKSLETPFYSARFDKNGYISSLIDKRVRREVAGDSSRPLGMLVFGEDVAVQYDNWEIDNDVFRKLSPAVSESRARLVSCGAVEIRLESEYIIGKKSRAKIHTVFYADTPRIDFEALIDWNEPHTVLKASFDVNVRSARCRNEIQFGHVERPTTRNNSIESAMFEVCQHKWTDLSETRYGVSILNDCKYGISVENGNMSITLHRGGTRPDATADSGLHKATYSLLPHVGGFSAENTVLPAYDLNCPPIAVSGRIKTGALSEPICSIGEANVICESVKRAEDEENAFVLRLYECEGSRTLANITVPGAKQIFRTNMLEEAEEELLINDSKIELEMRPFEIVTLLVK